MRIRRLKIILPPRLKDTAQHDARLLGEAVAKALWDNGGEAGPVTVNALGQRGHVLAQRVSGALPRGKGGGGHGG